MASNNENQKRFFVLSFNFQLDIPSDVTLKEEQKKINAWEIFSCFACSIPVLKSAGANIKITKFSNSSLQILNSYQSYHIKLLTFNLELVIYQIQLIGNSVFC